MTSKTVLLCIAGLLGSIALCFGAPVMSLGDNSSLIWRVGGALQHSDNIFLDSTDEESDTIWVFSPGLEFNVGQQPSNANLNISYVHDFVTYGDNNRLNRDNPNAKLNGFYRTAKSSINYGGSFRTNSQNDASANLAGDLAHRDLGSAHIDAEMELTGKSSVSGGYSYQDVNYEDPRFHDREAYSVPLSYYWAASPKLDMSVGYRFRYTSFERDPQYVRDNPSDPLNHRPHFDDHFFNVGVRGEVGAKTTGEIRVGIQDRNFNNRFGKKSADLFSADARLVWEATEKSNISFLASRDFDADAFGQSIERTDFQFAGTTELNEELSGFASIRFSNDDYQGTRSDDGIYGQVGVTYTPNLYSAISLAYIIYNNNSDYEPADFDNNVINFSGTLRY